MRGHALSRVVIRVALPTALAAGAIVLAFSAWQQSELHDHTAEARERYADLVGSLVAANLREAMLAADRPHLQRRLEEVAARAPIRAVWVARKSGEVVHTSDPGLIGQRLLKTDPTCTACHASPTEPPAKSPQTFWVEPQGEGRTLRAVRSILAEPECASCHDQPTGAPLGLLVTDLDDAALTGELREGATRAIWIVAAAALVLLAVLLIAVRFAVTRRLRDLRRLLSLLRAGGRVAVDSAESRDEIDEVEHLVQALADDLDDRLALDRTITRLLGTLERCRDAAALLLDDHGLVVAANRRAVERLSGPTRDALVGQPRAAWEGHDPELVAQAREDGWALAEDESGPFVARLPGRFGAPLGFLELWPDQRDEDAGEDEDEDDAPTTPAPSAGRDQTTLLYATVVGGELAPDAARFSGVLRIDRRLASARRLLSDLVRAGDEARADRHEVDLTSLMALATWELSRQLPEYRWHAWPEEGLSVVGARYQLRPLLQRLALAAAERAEPEGEIVLFTQQAPRSDRIYLAAWTPTDGEPATRPGRSLALAQALAHAHGGAVERDPRFDLRPLATQRGKRVPGGGVGALFVAELVRGTTTLRALR